MINFDEYTNENRINHNPNWPYIPDHPYRILVSGKTNALLNLINNQPHIDKIYLHAKDLYEPKYRFLINKRESIGLKHFKDPKAFRMICMMFIKILMIIILTEKIRY